MIRKIAIKSMDDVKTINNFATCFDYETFVHGKHEIVDAKSLLGLIALINKPDLCFVVPDDVNPKYAFKGIEKFAV